MRGRANGSSKVNDSARLAHVGGLWAFEAGVLRVHFRLVLVCSLPLHKHTYTNVEKEFLAWTVFVHYAQLHIMDIMLRCQLCGV
jgi:hypothetical protein